MRYTTMLKAALIMLSACGGERSMVDMTYRATVETVENDCDDYHAPDDMTVLVDIFLHSDGTMSFRNSSGLIPGGPEYGEIRVVDGKVDHKYAEDAAGDTDFIHHLKGRVNTEEIDLTLSVERRDTRSADFRTCAETARIRGTARPFGDPSALDGLYRMRYDFYGETCPGDAEEVRASWNVPLDIDPYRSDRTIFRFDEEDVTVVFETEVGPGGEIDDADGTLFIIVPYGFAELDLEVTGTATPGLADLSMVYRDPADTEDCYWRLDARGGKLVPDPHLDDNRFRVALRETDDCFRDEPFVQDFEIQARTVMQDDGRLTFMLGGRRYDLNREGPRIYGSFVSTYGTDTLDVEGVFSPPEITAEFDFNYNIGSDFECRDLFEMSGYARYFIPDEGTGFGVETKEVRARPAIMARPMPSSLLVDPKLTFRPLEEKEVLDERFKR